MGRPAINLVSQVFDRLTVIQRVENANDGHARWLCQCECGNTTTVSSNVLKKGHTKSCGCLNKEAAANKAKKQYKDLTNQQFGKLTAIEYLENSLWKCECECGNKEFITTSHHLLSGNTRSCGCLRSLGESVISKLLLEHEIEFIQQKQFDDAIYDETGGKMRFDFYLPKENRLIEYDGIQHYESTGGWNDDNLFKINQARDKVKNEYALTHNIPLVRIPYWERDKITLEMILGSTYEVREAGQPTG